MSAIPQSFVEATAVLGADATRPYPNSRKIYVQGSRPDIRVPMREIEQVDTPTRLGYSTILDSRLERDSDVHVLRIDRQVAATPLSLDLTSRTNLEELEQALKDGRRF